MPTTTDPTAAASRCVPSTGVWSSEERRQLAHPPGWSWGRKNGAVDMGLGGGRGGDGNHRRRSCGVGGGGVRGPLNGGPVAGSGPALERRQGGVARGKCSSGSWVCTRCGFMFTATTRMPQICSRPCRFFGLSNFFFSKICYKDSCWRVFFFGGVQKPYKTVMH